jgi:hypothetical protein
MQLLRGRPPPQQGFVPADVNGQAHRLSRERRSKVLIIQVSTETQPCSCLDEEDEADKSANSLSQGQPLCKDGVPGELLFLSRKQVDSLLQGSFAYVSGCF